MASKRVLTAPSAHPFRPLAPFALPYRDDFEAYPEDTLARFFSDMHGSFAVFTAGPGNKVLRQQAENVLPLSTHGRGAAGYAAVLGDDGWAGYTVTTMAKSEGNTQNGSAPDAEYVEARAEWDRGL